MVIPITNWYDILSKWRDKSVFIWKMSTVDAFTGNLEGVALAVTNIIGSEGKILNSTLKVCLFYIDLAGLLVFFCRSIFGF